MHVSYIIYPQKFHKDFLFLEKFDYWLSNNQLSTLSVLSKAFTKSTIVFPLTQHIIKTIQ